MSPKEAALRIRNEWPNQLFHDEDEQGRKDAMCPCMVFTFFRVGWRQLKNVGHLEYPFEVLCLEAARVLLCV